MKRVVISILVLGLLPATYSFGAEGVTLTAAPTAPTVAAAAAATGQSPPYAVNRKALLKVKLRAALRRLPTARQTPRGYDRSKFGGWRDADRDCRDTRAEVLVSESRRAVTGRCTVTRGRWYSSYDRRFWRRASDVDIDHLVPLFEVWRSGGKRWGTARRVAYANDLADARVLRAVTDNVNQSKGDGDPASWLPQYGRCGYVGQYVAVKTRWSLRVDAAEKQAMRKVASHCPNTLIRVHKARVVTRTPGTDPRFDTCREAIDHGYGPYYRGRDPEYDWYVDGDNDGIVCES